MIYSLIKVANQLEYNLYAYASEKLLNYLKAKYPKLAEQLNGFKNKNKYILWLNDRFGENPSKEDHPIEECIPILLRYSSKENSLSEKYKKEEFKKLVENKTKKIYKDLKEIDNMTSEEMKLILLSSDKKKETITLSSDIDVSGDKVGKVGEWNIWLPSSKENSIHIAQYDTDDAGNKEPKTTWCTARINGSNLFYNYIGNASCNFMLFYIIKDNAQKDNNEDFLSVGFFDCKPFLPSPNYGESVDRGNIGLSVERLQNIWGDNYQAIMSMMQKKCDELGGVSPAYPKIIEATKDLEKFKQLTLNNSKTEKAETIASIFINHNVDDSILKYFFEHEDVETRSLVAINIDQQYRTTITPILEKLIHDKSVYVRRAIARNTSNESVMEELIMDEDKTVREIIFEKGSLEHSEGVLIYVAKNIDEYIGYREGSIYTLKKILKPTAFQNLLTELSENDRDYDIKEIIAKFTTDENLLKDLSECNYESVKKAITNNKDADKDVLENVLISMYQDPSNSDSLKEKIRNQLKIMGAYSKDLEDNSKTAKLFKTVNKFYKLASLNN